MGGATADTQPTAALEQNAAIILDSLDHGVLAIDGEKQIVFVNRIAEGILQLAREELLGHRLDEVLKTPRNSRWLIYDPERVAVEEFQRVRRVKDGNRVILRSRTIPMRGESGEVMGSAAIFTEAADASEEMHADKDRLVSLGELSASVAHEIRNPLTGIRTTVQFVQSKLDGGDPRREDLNDVLAELDRIDQIITDLLLFARPQPVRSTPLELNSLLVKVLDSLVGRLEESSVTVKRVLADDLPAVLGDSDLLGQVFFNLVTNGIQAMSSEPGELKVTTTVRRSPSGKQRVNVFISDTGGGIPEKFMEQIFAPFFTTRSMGTGLGLSISLQIVRAHGGTITPRNRRAGGATFRVSLPALAVGQSPPDNEGNE
ncbi:MAG TPA: ATP-binding protein [Candidatus Udaeobacter sp.]|nr:ATP-binding protein [Candidatus Udaeobacter sp.]